MIDAEVAAGLAGFAARIRELEQRLEQDLVVIEGQLEALLEQGRSAYDDQEANFLVGHAQTIRIVLGIPVRHYSLAAGRS